MRSLADAMAAGTVILDGGLSTELEARGQDVSSALWSARLLRDDPAAIVAAHAAFAAAGAQVATTASYQATVEGFGAAGVDAGEARRLIASSVALARDGQGDGWVAGSVGPYGALLADGSEYTGGYVDHLTVAELRAFHRPRMELLAGAGADVLVAAADRAGWQAPRTLTAVLVPLAQVRGLAAVLDEATLQASGDLPDLPSEGDPTEHALVLVPDADGPVARKHLLRQLAGRAAVVGPARPWTRARSSYQRAVRVLALGVAGRDPVDSEDHLADLVVTADAEALADLRARALAPLSDLRPATAERLAETLRSWLLHQGRREAVAADLHVHPQTVRYRMGQLRELYGDRLEDPETIRDLTLALA